MTQLPEDEENGAEEMDIASDSSEGDGSQEDSDEEMSEQGDEDDSSYVESNGSDMESEEAYDSDSSSDASSTASVSSSGFEADSSLASEDVLDVIPLAKGRRASARIATKALAATAFATSPISRKSGLTGKLPYLS